MIKPAVFVLSDDPPTLDFIRNAVAAINYDPRCFASVEEFLTLLPRRQAGCIVINVAEPLLDDPALLSGILERASKLRAIVLAPEEGAAAWLEGGAYVVLRQPCSAAELQATIERAMNERE